MGDTTRVRAEASAFGPAAVLQAAKLLLIAATIVVATSLAPAVAPGSAGSTSLTAQIMRRGTVTVPLTADAADADAITSSNGRYVEQVEQVERDGEMVTLITVVIDL